MSSSVNFLVVTNDTKSAQILQKKDERTVIYLYIYIYYIYIYIYIYIYTPWYYHPKKRNNTKKIEHNTTFFGDGGTKS